MSLQPVVDSPEIFIGRDDENRWLYVGLRGGYDAETAQMACGLMLESLRRWPCCKILSDGTSVDHIYIHRTHWGAQWLEEMGRAGLQCMAWVLPRNLLARQATEAKLYDIETLRVGTFDDLASAYAWLQQQREQ